MKQESSKVVLFMPRRFRGRGEGTSQRTPLELLSLSGPLLDHGYNVCIVDANVRDDYLDEVLNVCDGAVCLGISCILGYQIIDGIEVAGMVRQRFPELSIIWGGWFPSVRPELFLDKDVGDLVVMGQGEVTFREVVDRIQSDTGFHNLPGVVFRGKGDITRTAPRPIARLDDLPMMPFDLVDYETYFRSDPEYPMLRYYWAAARGQAWPADEIRAFWTISSWGCPNDCQFCCSAGVTARRWTSLKPARILDELEPISKKLNIDVVCFCDANFFTDYRRVLELCQMKMDRNVGFHWAATTEPRSITAMTEDEFEIVSKSGCFCLFVGSESGSKESLSRMRKNHRPEDNERCAELLVRHRITPILSYIVGIPGESERSIQETIEQCRHIKARYPNVIITMLHYLPLPGSGFYAQALDDGFKEPEGLSEWGERGEVSFYGRPVFSDMTRSQERTIARLRHLYFYVVDLPWLKEGPLNPGQKFLRSCALLRLKTGLLGFPLEFWAARAVGRFYRSARGLR